MPADISADDKGLVTIRVTGRLSEQDVQAMQARAAELIHAAGSVRVLVTAEGFEGWEKGGDWAEFGQMEANDPWIERMAIVGEERWRDLALLFVAAGMRPFPIQYFPGAEHEAALAWLRG